jgi:hypothetical protein
MAGDDQLMGVHRNVYILPFKAGHLHAQLNLTVLFPDFVGWKDSRP